MTLLEQVIERAQALSPRRLLARPFVRNVGVLTMANGVNAVLSFVQGILVARWLGPELYGVAALVMTIPSLVYTFFDARSAEASVKFLSEFHVRGEGERALAMCKVGYAVDFTIALSAFLVCLFIAPWAAQNIAHRPEVVGLIVLYAGAFLPRALVGTSYAILASFGSFPAIAFIEVMTSLVRVVLVLGLVGLGWQVAGVVWGNAMAMVLTGLFYSTYAFPIVKRQWGRSWWQGDWHLLKGRCREIFGFLIYNDLNALLGMIPKQLDVALLGYFRNPTEVGYYKLAKSLAGVVSYVVTPLQSVAYPDLAQRWGIGDMQDFWQRVRKLAVQVGLPLGFAILLGAVPIPFVLPLLLGDAYRPAVPASQILLAGSAVWMAFFWLKPTYFAQGRIKRWMGISTIVVLLSVAGFFLTIPKWGYIGLCILNLLMQSMGHTLVIALLKRGV